MGLVGGWKFYMSDLRVMFLMTSCRYCLLAGCLVGVVMNDLTNRTLLYCVSP
jgi:hypothetical protein